MEFEKLYERLQALEFCIDKALIEAQENESARAILNSIRRRLWHLVDVVGDGLEEAERIASEKPQEIKAQLAKVAASKYLQGAMVSRDSLKSEIAAAQITKVFTI